MQMKSSLMFAVIRPLLITQILIILVVKAFYIMILNLIKEGQSMIIPASNDFLVKIFNQYSTGKVKEITKRELYDYSLYSMLEFIAFDNIDEIYVLKTLKRPVKHEIEIHKFVNNFAINGAHFIAGYSSDFLNLHFIIMEYIKDISPVYNYDDKELVEFYAELAKNLGLLHVNSKKYIQSLKKNNIIEFSLKYYDDLLDKFAEKLPMLSAEIKNDLYLTPDIIEQFLQKKELIKKKLLRIQNLRRTLVHGDFDVGNIFLRPINNNEKKIMAIDWGLSHIDLPIVDMANLLNSLKILSSDDRNYILESYLKIAQKEFPKNYSLNNFQDLGMMLHRLFFIEFQLNTLETSSNSVDEYYEQIHNALVSLTDLVEKID